MKKKHFARRAAALLLLLCMAVGPAACAPRGEGKSTPRGGESPHAGVVYLDAGHGGFDAGAIGVTAEGESIKEKDIALDIARQAGAALEALGYTVLYSREGDERLTYTTARDEVIARRAAAEAAGVALLVSVHGNAYAGAGRAYGARVYYNPETEGGEAAARTLAAAVSEHTGSLIGRDCATVADGSYYVLANPALPALLFEVGFLSDSEELRLLAAPDYRAALAAAICHAVDEILTGT